MGKQRLTFSKKIARDVTRKILRFKGEFNCTVEFSGKIIKTKVIVIKKSSNLFWTDWMNQFNLLDLPMSLYCNKINVLFYDAEKLKIELKIINQKFFLKLRGDGKNNRKI